jgi:hypothetical protein
MVLFLALLRYFISACAISLALAWSEPAAAQRMKAGLLACDVSAGIGYIIHSHKDISCVLTPDGSDRQRTTTDRLLSSDWMWA